ncbi:MAG: hypothetical protein KME36_08340 [Candidatus Thiodiazotropha sp. (ex Lucina pensylvanica)]|nr:hypothetical protein [Candidatus Thiodiazotropha sp. (ex Lucina pensylvanica)]MBT3050936.1 hypothetical protein [Candidatus Thiodiazotropha sp. (ex Codakia orbicularis)]
MGKVIEMFNPKRFLVTLISGFSVMLQAMPTIADDSIYLPCPSTTVGNTWQYKSSGAHGSETISKLITSRDGSKVAVSEKKVTKPMRPHPSSPEPPELKSSADIQYEVVGQTIVQHYYKGDMMRVFYNPHMPFCGKLSKQTDYQTKSGGMGQTFMSHVTTTVRSLGKEKIIVPAGTFDATVVEFQTKGNTKLPQPGMMATPDTVVVQYAVEKVGIVKSIMKTVAMMPVANTVSDPQSELLVSQGIEKMKKGEDINDILKKMGSLPPPDYTGQNLKFQPVQSEIITELQSYRVDPQ